MLLEKVSEPANTEWTRLIIFANKTDGLLCFFVDFGRVIEVAVRNSNPAPRMNESIDHLGKARIFSTLNTNLKY